MIGRLGRLGHGELKGDIISDPGQLTNIHLYYIQYTDITHKTQCKICNKLLYYLDMFLIFSKIFCQEIKIIGE